MLHLLLFLNLATAALSPPKRDLPVFRSSGSFTGGDTRNLNLERIELLKKGDTERIDLTFTAGSRKLPSPRIPPFQLRYDPQESENGRLLLLLQGISGRNVHRLALNSITTTSDLIKHVRIFPPLEDGDTVVELSLKRKVEFRPEQERKGSLRLALRAAPR
ncbi:MAG: hypothetical protein HYR96_01565 [Deltaproteobacteria bacterium]|nr:hypothetical protein [Deltaproteobacteria bacterium]MBI3294418.1 hypothetical protein [Deltaproteobacteria bacterium]